MSKKGLQRDFSIWKSASQRHLFWPFLKRVNFELKTGLFDQKSKKLSPRAWGYLHQKNRVFLGSKSCMGFYFDFCEKYHFGHFGGRQIWRMKIALLKWSKKTRKNAPKNLCTQNPAKYTAGAVFLHGFWRGPQKQLKRAFFDQNHGFELDPWKLRFPAGGKRGFSTSKKTAQLNPYWFFR